MLIFIFNAPTTTETYTYLHSLSRHDDLPILVTKTICKGNAARREGAGAILQAGEVLRFLCPGVDRSKRRRQQHRGGRGCQAISLEHHPRYLPFMRPAVAGT